MEVVSNVQRRKACDLCFTKKIKCDMLKPVCSNCVLYKAECKTTAVRRRIALPKEKGSGGGEGSASRSGQQQEDPSRIAELESRLAMLEAQLRRATRAAAGIDASPDAMDLSDEYHDPGPMRGAQSSDQGRANDHLRPPSVSRSNSRGSVTIDPALSNINVATGSRPTSAGALAREQSASLALLSDPLFDIDFDEATGAMVEGADWIFDADDGITGMNPSPASMPANSPPSQTHSQPPSQAYSHSSSRGHAEAPPPTRPPVVLTHPHPHNPFSLPPLEQILPVIDAYFIHFNSLVPLFQQGAFMRLLDDWYSLNSSLAAEETGNAEPTSRHPPPSPTLGTPSRTSTANNAGRNRRAVWAAINIVLAMGYRLAVNPERISSGLAAANAPAAAAAASHSASSSPHNQPYSGPPGGPTVTPHGISPATTEDTAVHHCLRNAQSVVSELVTRDDDLLGLQVLLGMVMLFQGTRDPRPATVLIGTAVRLCHRLRLQQRAGNGLDSILPGVGSGILGGKSPWASTAQAEEMLLHRDRLFWIAYMLDKDVSLRSKTPSVQLDVDIDLALPQAEPLDGGGDLFTLDGTVRFNFFRSRVQLSHIEGKVYDLLYSTRARRMNQEERQQRVERLDQMLDEWRAAIPLEMQLEGGVLGSLGRVAVMHMTILHHTYLICLVMVHGIYSHDAEWVRRLSAYSRVALDEREWEGGAGGGLQQMPPLPRAWDKCVAASRACLRLFYMLPQTDCSIWYNSCAYFSGNIILLANMFEFPSHDLVSVDGELTRHALSLFEQMKTLTDHEMLHKLYGVIVDLDRRAREAVGLAAAKRKQQQEQRLGQPEQGQLGAGEPPGGPFDLTVEALFGGGGPNSGGTPFVLTSPGAASRTKQMAWDCAPEHGTEPFLAMYGPTVTNNKETIYVYTDHDIRY